MQRAGHRHRLGTNTVLAQCCHGRFAADQETRPAPHDEKHRETRPAPMVDRRSLMPGRRLPGLASAKPGAGGRRSLREIFLMAPRLLAREVRQRSILITACTAPLPAMPASSATSPPAIAIRPSECHGHRDRRRQGCGTCAWRCTAGRSRCCGAGDRQQQPDRQRPAHYSELPRKTTERLTLAPGVSTVKPG